MMKSSITLIRKLDTSSGYLAGRLLIAMPSIQDGCFNRAVVYICAHNEKGAMGVIVNASLQSITLHEVLDQLAIPVNDESRDIPVHFGGPIDAHRGFVLHSADALLEESLVHENGIALTSNVSILRDIAGGQGPEHGCLMLGYAGWGEGQLEAEIEAGSWIVAPASKEIVFDAENNSKWSLAAASLGIADVSRLSMTVGHA